MLIKLIELGALPSEFPYLSSVFGPLSSACRGVLWGRSPKGEAPSSQSEYGSSAPLFSVLCPRSSDIRPLSSVP